MTAKVAQGFRIYFQLVLQLFCAHNVLGRKKERKYKEKILSSAISNICIHHYPSLIEKHFNNYNAKEYLELGIIDSLLMILNMKILVCL